jgi:hypothetical protein
MKNKVIPLLSFLLGGSGAQASSNNTLSIGQTWSDDEVTFIGNRSFLM